MRVIATADLHYNHARSRPLADEIIDRINQTAGDVLLVVGDTATADGEVLEQCLSRFQFAGPKLFVAGNHELWTTRHDSYEIYSKELPRRVKAMGWHWLEKEAFIRGNVAIVGSVGWYDYSFAQPNLEIPRRFYERKISPGAAGRYSEFSPLFANTDDLSASARDIVARWNDGRHVKLHRSDEAFLEEQLARLKSQLDMLKSQTVIAAIHHLPFRELLPPPHSAQWDFAKAYLGSERLGELLLQYPNVEYAVCGHSHLALEAKIRHIHAINIGSGYRWKTFREIDIQ